MASGYDLSNKVTFRLLASRLGIQNQISSPGLIGDIEGVQHQNTMLQHHGGSKQQERMIKDKRRSLDKALWYSYQGADVLKVDASNRTPVRALITPNKLKQDYDDKVISIGYEYNFEPGTVFEWIGTKTHWLVYLQDLTELAYFRGEIRRCSYQLAWEDNEELHTTYAAIRGPVETRIEFLQKHNISIDRPNDSLNLLIPKNESTLKYFKRYQKFYLQGDDTCWRIESVDAISTPGIIEISAVEYYANETVDDIENGLVNGKIEPVQDPNLNQVDILGDTFIKVKKIYSYSFEGTEANVWSVDPKYPVKIEVDPKDPRNVSLIWTSSYSGQFDLFYGEYKKTVIVESLF